MCQNGLNVLENNYNLTSYKITLIEKNFPYSTYFVQYGKYSHILKHVNKDLHQIKNECIFLFTFMHDFYNSRT